MNSNSRAQFKSMQLSSFIEMVRENETPSEAKDILRFVQRACFNLMWSGCDTRLTRTFSNIGQITQHLFRENPSKKQVLERLAEKPFVGVLKANARMKYHDDLRFIIAASDKQIFLVFDNNASDQGLTQIHCYSSHTDIAGFVEHPSIVPHSALADFLMTNTLHI